MHIRDWPVTERPREKLLVQGADTLTEAELLAATKEVEYSGFEYAGNTTGQVEHEASTSKIGEDQIFYCNQRGLPTQDAVNMIVNGYCKEVFKELPMEFAVEAQKLLGVSLEGSVG